MSRGCVRFALSAALSAVSLLAQLPDGVQFGEPVLGYVADPSRNGIRAVRGFGQAAWVGSLFPITLAMTNVATAPGAKFFLLQSEQPRRAWILTSTGDIFGIQTPPEPGNTTPWRVAFSPQAKFTLLYRERERRAWLYSKLLQPGYPPVAVILPAEPQQATVSDDGTRILISSRQGLYYVDSKGKPLLHEAGFVADGLAFLPEGAGAGPASGAIALHEGRLTQLSFSPATSAEIEKRILGNASGLTGPLSRGKDGKGWVARSIARPANAAPANAAGQETAGKETAAQENSGEAVALLDDQGKLLQRLASPCPVIDIAATADPTSLLLTGSPGPNAKHCLLDMAESPARIYVMPGAPVRAN